MSNLLILLALIFGGVALMVTLGERFARPADPEQAARLSRWLWPLVGLMLLLSLLDYYLF
jgi:hypothetical protein